LSVARRSAISDQRAQGGWIWFFLIKPAGPRASLAGANKTRGAAIKNQLNTEIAACDKKQKEQEHKHAHDASHGVEQPESTRWTSK
jgi:hypothetical protein